MEPSANMAYSLFENLPFKGRQRGLVRLLYYTQQLFNMARRTRKFDGYTYTLYKSCQKKSTADNVAAGLRINKNKFSRVVKTTEGYKIYQRPMRGRGWSK